MTAAISPGFPGDHGGAVPECMWMALLLAECVDPVRNHEKFQAIAYLVQRETGAEVYGFSRGPEGMRSLVLKAAVEYILGYAGILPYSHERLLAGGLGPAGDAARRELESAKRSRTKYVYRAASAAERLDREDDLAVIEEAGRGYGQQYRGDAGLGDEEIPGMIELIDFVLGFHRSDVLRAAKTMLARISAARRNAEPDSMDGGIVHELSRHAAGAVVSAVPGAMKMIGVGVGAGAAPAPGGAVADAPGARISLTIDMGDPGWVYSEAWPWYNELVKHCKARGIAME